MSRITRLALLLLIVLAPLPAAAATDLEVSARHFDNPARVGTARFSYLFWDVYDARLVSPDGVYRRDGPVALTLVYLRTLKGSAIVERSLSEMRRLGMGDETRLAAWGAELSRLIPDVRESDTISGVRDRDGRTFFYVNGALAGRIDDAGFGRYFFDIWLGPDSLDRRFTAQLTGN